MEILSTGQKIKRARIYKGITLKELCKDKISISKMSCIENGKVKADEDTIRYIADIIQVDYDYLMQDIYEQIFNNLKTIKAGNAIGRELEDNININLGYAIEYEYYDLALELIHILFTYYLNIDDESKCNNIISKYYSVYEKSNCDEATITYYLDIAKFLSKKGEYFEAIVYYSRLRELNILKSAEKGVKNKVILNEAKCYLNIEEFDKCYNLLRELIVDEDNSDYSEIYQYYALVCIILGYKDADIYIKKFFDSVQDNPMNLAYGKEKFSEAYFKIGNEDLAIKEIKEAVELFPIDKEVELVEYNNRIIELLFKNEKYDYAHELVEKNLNTAISCNNIKLIEKSYYLKGMILNKKGKINEAEMYLNLSLDSLYKFGSKKERCDRYLDMAHLYYKLNNNRDAIKYFNLSMEIEKDL